MKTKESIRKTILAKRKLLSAEEIAAKSSEIDRKLNQLDCVKNSASFLCYLSKKDEVDTRGIIKRLLGLGKIVYVPVTLGHGIMNWSVLKSLDSIIPGPFGISEPKNKEIESPPPDSPVIVPCLAFSSHRHRIGYGGGYFDRFLHDHPGMKIGLAFEMQHVDRIPRESHDIPLDYILTESSIYR